MHTLVVLDFWTAFQKILHKLLIQKLSRLPRIRTPILMWIHDFFLNRKQRVKIKGQSQLSSEEWSGTSGVPLWSVFGPTFFLVYLTAFLECVNCSTALVSLPTTLFYQVIVNNNIRDKPCFQTNINAMQNWGQPWCMSFNVEKCSLGSAK